MKPSKLAIAGLCGFFNQLLTSQQLSALIYQAKYRCRQFATWPQRRMAR